MNALISGLQDYMKRLKSNSLANLAKLFQRYLALKLLS